MKVIHKTYHQSEFKFTIETIPLNIPTIRMKLPEGWTYELSEYVNFNGVDVHVDDYGKVLMDALNK